MAWKQSGRKAREEGAHDSTETQSWASVTPRDPRSVLPTSLGTFQASEAAAPSWPLGLLHTQLTTFFPKTRFLAWQNSCRGSRLQAPQTVQCHLPDVRQESHTHSVGFNQTADFCPQSQRVLTSCVLLSRSDPQLVPSPLKGSGFENVWEHWAGPVMVDPLGVKEPGRTEAWFVNREKVRMLLRGD